jgi:hypothetical protein
MCTLLLPQGQTGEAGRLQNALLSRKSGTMDRTVVSHFQPLKGQTNVGGTCTVSLRKDGILLWVSFVGPCVAMLVNLGQNKV